MRFTRTLLFTLAALLAVAWPLSRAGLTCAVERPGKRTSVSLAGRGLILQLASLPPPKPLDRDRLTISVQPALAEPPSLLTFGTITQTTSVFTLSVQLPPLIAAAACGGLLLTVYPWARAHRRARRKLCPQCKYPRPVAEGACSECGVWMSQALLQSRPRWRSAARDVGAWAFVAIAALAAAASVFVFMDEQSAEDHRAKAFDYSWYLQKTQPRLTGAVTFARPGDDLMSLVASASPGTTVVLLPGRHHLGAYQDSGSTPVLDNLWLVGCGPGVTTLSAHIEKANSLRIEGVTIQCGDNELCQLRNGGSLQLRNCRVGGYNSGAGGSNAIFGAGTVLLIEECEFEGKTGRASATMRGNPFDLREENHVFIRNTHFIDNQHIFRSAEGVVDGCTFTSDMPNFAFPPSGEALCIRNSPFVGPRAASGSGIPITECLDDFDILAQIARDVPPDRAFTDPSAREAARTLDTGKSAFWRRLLVHPDARVRTLAQSAARLPAAATPSMTLEFALTQLDKATMPGDVVLGILAANDSARGALEGLSRSGSTIQQGNAAALLQLMNVQPSFAELIRYEELRAAP
jgi:hypothetical protein